MLRKPIEQLGIAAVKARIKRLHALPELNEGQRAERTKLEAREWVLYREKNPPVKTPPNFIEKDLDW